MKVRNLQLSGLRPDPGSSRRQEVPTSKADAGAADPSLVRLVAAASGDPGAAPARRATAAFTMIEIALSLAIIGFALVAIIGVLPKGLDVQRENTEETIINHDTSILLDAICNGQQGLDDLTNYVAAITNYQTIFNLNGTLASVPNPERILAYTYTNSLMNGAALTPGFPLLNGTRIVGLLSTPKYVRITTPQHETFYVSNHIVATIQAMTGLASDKAPQINSDVRQMALSYRLTSEVVPCGYGLAYTNPVEVVNLNNMFYTDWTNFVAYTNPTVYQTLTPPNASQWISRSNNWRYATALQPEMYDIRLLFRWPVTQSRLGGSRYVARSIAGGPVAGVPVQLQGDFPILFPASLPYQLYFAQPNQF